MGVSRRQFVMGATTISGALALGVGMAAQQGGQGTGLAPPRIRGQYWGGDERDAREINAWIVIERDDAVTLRVSHAEMGQGISTGLATLIAEELECDWSRVRVEFGSPNRNAREKVYDNMMTVGSRGIRATWNIAQQAGASARERLISAAARRWNVAPDSCRAASSRVTHVPSGRRLRYGELVTDAAGDPARQRAGAAHATAVQAGWQVAGPCRCAAEGQWRGEVRHRHAAAGHGARGDRVLPGDRREAGVRRRVLDPWPARRAAGGEAAERGRRGRRQLLACERGAEAAEAGDALGYRRCGNGAAARSRSCLSRDARRSDGGGAQRWRRGRTTRGTERCHRSRLRGAASRTRDDGAAECDRAPAPGPSRCLGGLPGLRHLRRTGREGHGPEARAGVPA